MYMKNDKMYCNYCNNKLTIDRESFSYNHGYHTRYTTKYTCNCEDFEKIIVSETD